MEFFKGIRHHIDLKEAFFFIIGGCLAFIFLVTGCKLSSDIVAGEPEEIIIEDAEEDVTIDYDKTDEIIIEDAEEEARLRKTVYDSFDDITSKLSLEEKWWFFEIIDEMKRREPDYPDGLKRAYIKLCRIGIEQSLGKHHRLEVATLDHV